MAPPWTKVTCSATDKKIKDHQSFLHIEVTGGVILALASLLFDYYLFVTLCTDERFWKKYQGRYSVLS